MLNIYYVINNNYFLYIKKLVFFNHLARIEPSHLSLRGDLMIIRKFNLLTVSIFAASLFVSLDTYAQQSEASDSRLEEVVVTAQKKEEGLSEVPISIQVLSDEMIESRGVTSMKHLSEYVPGLHISKGAGEWNVYMRGIGSGTNKGFSQSITTFVDGMAITQGSQYSAPLMDVERVEVLRGTQGVLFGKNTIGGVINIVSKNPTIGGETEGNWGMEFVPEWGTQKYNGAMNIPVSDSFAMRIAAQKEMSDGWVTNAFQNAGASPETESEAIRATMLWEMDNLEVNLKLSSMNTVKKGSEIGIYRYELSAPFGAMATATPPYNGAVVNWRLTNAFYPDQISGVPGVTFTDNSVYQNPTGGTVDSENAILKLSTTWNDHDVVSTTSYSVYDYKWGLDADMGPLNIIAVDNDVDFKSVSHEVTISSPADDTFEYIVGIYVDDIHYDGINDGYFDMTAGGLFPQLFPAPDLVALATQGAASASSAGRARRRRVAVSRRRGRGNKELVGKLARAAGTSWKGIEAEFPVATTQIQRGAGWFRREVSRRAVAARGALAGAPRLLKVEDDSDVAPEWDPANAVSILDVEPCAESDEDGDGWRPGPPKSQTQPK